MLEPPPVTLEPVRENSTAAAEKIAAENDSAKRNMTSFFDTRMNRMGAMSQPVAEPRIESAPTPAAEFPHPPRLPELYATSDSNGGVEDAAAQLLRPILKQWLTENMPRIVEKALLNEAGGDGRGGPSRR